MLFDNSMKMTHREVLGWALVVTQWNVLMIRRKVWVPEDRVSLYYIQMSEEDGSNNAPPEQPETPIKPVARPDEAQYYRKSRLYNEQIAQISVKIVHFLLYFSLSSMPLISSFINFSILLSLSGWCASQGSPEYQKEAWTRVTNCCNWRCNRSFWIDFWNKAKHTC